MKFYYWNENCTLAGRVVGRATDDFRESDNYGSIDIATAVIWARPVSDPRYRFQNKVGVNVLKYAARVYDSPTAKKALRQLGIEEAES